jgi:flagellar biosynthetic protein FliR
MFYQPLSTEVFTYLVVFSRLGSTLVVLPGIGEPYIPTRVRLLFALMITVLLTPVVANRIPELPEQLSDLFLLLSSEIFIGLAIGFIARFLITALAWGGTIISFLSGFSAAQVFNPMLADQGTLPAVLLSLGGLLLIFATDTHHLMFFAIADSYTLFVPGIAPVFGEFADTFATLMSQSFMLAMQFATPFMVFAIVFYTGMGLLARLQPQMPVFFVALPLQILIALVIFSLVIPTILLWFLDRFEASVSFFFLAS